jgi:uncharacterized membrane protein (UPF0136 family)
MFYKKWKHIKKTKMKNTTTAFLLTIICMVGYYFSDASHMFIASSIFASAYLILAQLEENGNKL